MSLLSRFKKKPPGSTGTGRKPVDKKSSAIDAQEIVCGASDDGHSIVGFGLRWRTLIQAAGNEASIKLAKQGKATHYQLRGQQVGYGKVPKDVKGAIYSAAGLAAKTHSGLGVFAIELSPTQYWFAVVRNGQPTNNDEVLGGMSSADAVGHVRAILAQFTNEYSTVFSDIPNSGLENQQSFSLHDLFEIPRNDTDLLVAIPKTGSSIPKPVIYAAAGVLALIALQRGWSEYQTHLVAASKPLIQSDDPPEVAWAPVIKSFLDSVALPNAAVLAPARLSLESLPVLWWDWSLSGARCEAAKIAPDKSRLWSCNATYARGRLGATSEKMNQIVKARMPTASVGFPTISSMTLGWSVSISEQATMSLAQFPVAQDIPLPLMSTLQSYAPALAGTQDFKFVPVELVAPKKNDGTAQPWPSNVPEILSGPLVLKGPLRTIDAVHSLFPHVDWYAIGLTADAKGDASQKSVAASALTAELSGMIYAVKQPLAAAPVAPPANPVAGADLLTPNQGKTQ